MLEGVLFFSQNIKNEDNYIKTVVIHRSMREESAMTATEEKKTPPVAMTLTEKFISILRSRITGEALPETVKAAITPADEQPLYLLAKKHDFAHAVGDVLLEEGLLTLPEAVEAFGRAQYLAAFRYQRIVYELSRLRSLFETEGVDFMPLKGSVLREAYPDPVLRTSCDIDILVHVEDLSRACDLIRTHLSYRFDQNKKKNTVGYHDVTFFTESDLHIELHFSLLGENMPSEGPLTDPWQGALLAEGTRHEYRMPGEVFFFYHVAHAAKHFKLGGCGVRPFMDLYVLERSFPYDEKVLNSYLEQAGLCVFAREMTALSHCWFGGEEKTPLLSAMEEYVLSGGIYGSFGNRMAATQRHKGRVHYIFRRIFPPYRTMKLYHRYLEHFPFLLPFAWVARWFSTLFGGRAGNALREIQKSHVDDSTISDVRMLFDELSL